MKKTSLVILIISFMALGVIGCTNSNQVSEKNNMNNNENKEITLDNYLENLGYKKFSIQCDEIQKDNIVHIDYIAVDGSTTFIVLNNNEIYDLNVSKLYSTTNSNCKLNKNEDNTILYLSLLNNVSVPNSKDIYRTGNFNQTYAIFDDNTVAKLDDDNLTIESHINIDLKDDEKMLKLNGTHDKPVLKTNFAYYTLVGETSNEDKCQIYADIDCNYTYKYKLDNISIYYNKILYYDGHILLDNELNLYTRDFA